MKLWTIGDLHLSLSGAKPMDIFGPLWTAHHEKIAAAWHRAVGPEDVVLIPGDISWAMRLEEAQIDLEWISALPGAHKVMIRGNHDFWWSTRRKMQAASPSDLEFIHNNALRFGPYVVSGSRGWELQPPTPLTDSAGSESPPAPLAEDVAEELAQFERVQERERDRLDRSLQVAEGLRSEGTLSVCMLHYPPLLVGMESSIFTEVLDRHAPDLVVYGHLHGEEAFGLGFQGQRGKTTYLLASADALGFEPLRLDSGR